MLHGAPFRIQSFVALAVLPVLPLPHVRQMLQGCGAHHTRAAVSVSAPKRPLPSPGPVMPSRLSPQLPPLLLAKHSSATHTAQGDMHPPSPPRCSRAGSAHTAVPHLIRMDTDS